MRLPDPCLVVLVGASGAGKSTWAAEQFGSWPVVSTDALRAVVGRDEHDQRASKDAFDLVGRIVEARLKRRFTTVVDSTGLDGKHRRAWVAVAQRRGIPAYAVVFDVDERTVRSRNRARARPVPSAVLRAQLRSLPAVRELLEGEGFAGVLAPGDVELVPARFLTAPAAASRQREDQMALEFGLQLGRFPAGLDGLAELARAAEDVGFTSLTFMDHLVQIPQVGPEWEDMPESWTTAAYLAGVTRTARLGALVTNIGLRNIAHLGKVIATVDVLSGGRAFCALGAGWFDREMQLYGFTPEPAARRLDRLEDALQLLPLLWGPGSPPFEGRTISTPAATCYPRPVQEHLPIVVGGGGEKRTLRLVAQYADGTNLFGEPDDVRAKVAVLHRHCDEVGRDPAEIRITHFGEAGVMPPGGERDEPVVGTVDELIGRYRELAEAGVTEAFVGLHHDGMPGSLESFAPVIEAFRASP